MTPIDPKQGECQCRCHYDTADGERRHECNMCCLDNVEAFILATASAIIFCFCAYLGYHVVMTIWS